MPRWLFSKVTSGEGEGLSVHWGCPGMWARAPPCTSSSLWLGLAALRKAAGSSLCQQLPRQTAGRGRRAVLLPAALSAEGHPAASAAAGRGAGCLFRPGWQRGR